MREIIAALLQNPVGICVAILMGLAIATFVAWYVFYMIVLPVMSLASAGKVMLAGLRKKTAKLVNSEDRACLVVGPQLGFTMADGGKDIEDEEKE